MKQFVLVLILGLFLVPQIGVSWSKVYGGPQTDYGTCVQITSDGNYVITGRTNSQLWILKVDTSGGIIWSRTYTTGEGKWLEETSDGGYIVAGRPLLLKTNEYGDSEWILNIPNPVGALSSVCGYSVLQTPDSDYIVTGVSRTIFFDEFLHLLGASPEGDSLWAHNYIYPPPIGEAGYGGHCICKAYDGNYMIAGVWNWYYDEKLWLLKINSQGDTLWTKAYNRGDIDRAYSIQQTTDSGFIVSGTSQTWSSSWTHCELWLLKLNSHGDTTWTRKYSKELSQVGFSVKQTADGGYIVVGGVPAFAAGETNGSDLWLIKTNEYGDTLWTRTYGGEEYDAGYCVQQTPDGGYIIVGETESFGSGESDLWLIKTDANGDTIPAITEQPPASYPTFKILTPIGPQVLCFFSPSTKRSQVSVFDASGRKVDELDVPQAGGVVSWGEEHNPGVYFIVADIDGNRQTEKVILIR